MSRATQKDRAPSLEKLREAMARASEFGIKRKLESLAFAYDDPEEIDDIEAGILILDLRSRFGIVRAGG